MLHLVAATDTSAEPETTVCFGSSLICAHIRTVGPGALAEAAASGGPLIEWRDMAAFDVHACWRNPDGTIGMLGGGDMPQPGAEFGPVRLLVPYSTVTGQRVGEGIERCSLDPAPPPLLPAPPTAVELWDAAGLPQPALHASPPGGGLVGFETWFWSNVPPTPVQATVTLRGWQATVVAEPVEWVWDPGDGTPALRATRPGTPEDPAARHPYTRKGTYEVTHTVVWRGTFTLAGYGVVQQAESLGTVRPATTTPYPVQEREAVLVG